MRVTMAIGLAALLGASAAAQTARDPHLPAPTFDALAPALPAGMKDGVLIVSKTNGWRHLEHIPHSNVVIAALAKAAGRASFVTENAAVFNDALLARFRVVVLNSATGDILTPEQCAAFARWMTRGGGLVALHGATDGSNGWAEYHARVVGADYAGHPGGKDQFQSARVVIDAPGHPVMKGVRLPWAPVDEWYSYKTSPRGGGMTVLARIDEASYRPGDGRVMGADHPVVWTSAWGRGRVVSATLGHTAEAYDDANYRRLIGNAIAWVGERR